MLWLPCSMIAAQLLAKAFTSRKLSSSQRHRRLSSLVKLHMLNLVSSSPDSQIHTHISYTLAAHALPQTP